jgi:hypothetical protein
VEELNTDVERVVRDLEAVPPPVSHRERDIMMRRQLRKAKERRTLLNESVGSGFG